MQAVICRRVGRIPKKLDDSSGAPTKADEKFASLSVLHGVPKPAQTPAQEASGLWVRIHVAAASLNFADALTVMGKYQERPPLPFIPGAEVSGTVTEVGPRVTAVAVGDPVCAVVGTGAFASEVVTEERKVFLIPRGCEMVTAAALPVAYGTAHLALSHRATLQPGEVLLVLGAGGGVGLAAVQLGKIMGARVIAVARGPEKAAVLRDAGADCVIDSAERGLREGVRECLQGWGGPKGVDVVFDTVGGTQFEESMRLVNWGARILVIGFASGQIPTIAANIALVKNLTVHGIYWGSYMDHKPAVLRNSMEQMLQWLAEGKISIQVSHRLKLDQVLDAFNAILLRKAIGKVVLVPAGKSRL